MASKNNLTKRQEEIYSFIKTYINEHHRSPSLEDIGSHFEIAPSSVFDHLKALEKKNIIKRDKTARSISIVDGNTKQLKALELDFHLQDGSMSKLIVSNLFIEDDVNYFAIEMGDDSMKNAGLIPHDILIFRKTKSAKENDIIICMVNSTEEVMIRRYTLQASRILLVPENDNIPSKVCKEITIYGILTKVIRNYE